jgi:ribosomal protein L20A (L18A)
MSEVKTFIVTGKIKKPSGDIQFSKKLMAVKEKHVEEKIYAELGSRHKAKRSQIVITKIEEEKQSSKKETAPKK